MNFFNLQGFIENYGLPALIISIIVAVISIVLDIALKNKLFSIKSYLPFIMAIILMSIYELIFGSFFLNTKEISSAAIICGSTSSGIFAIFKRFSNGKSIDLSLPFEVLEIEGFLQDIIEENKKQEVAELIYKIIESASKKSDFDLTVQKVTEILKSNKINETTDLIISNTAYTIVCAFVK